MDWLRKVKSILKNRWPRLAMAYCAIRDSSGLLREPHLTPLGFRFAGSPEIARGAFEPAETDIVKTYLRAAEGFVNVGANLGYYCCIARGLGKETIAFEPLQSNLQYLYANLAANGWTDLVEVFPIALGNRIGLTQLYGSGTGASVVPEWAGASRHAATIVPVSTLDCILGDRWRGRRLFILVDIEGGELPMLEGAVRHLDMHPQPVWLVEVCVSENQPAGRTVNPHLRPTFQMFWDRGYEAHTADRRRLLVTAEAIERVCETGVNCFESHNFLFTPRKDRWWSEVGC